MQTPPTIGRPGQVELSPTQNTRPPKFPKFRPYPLEKFSNLDHTSSFVHSSGMSGYSTLIAANGSVVTDAAPFPVKKIAAVAQLTHASVSQALAASTALVAAVAQKQVKVYEIVLVAATATTVQLFDGATALTGVMSLAAGTPLVLTFGGEPHFVTTAGNALNMALGGAVQVSGFVRFIQS